MVLTIIKIYHCAQFEVILLNDVQNFPQKLKKRAKYGYFQTFENSPKIEKNLTDLTFGEKVTIIQMYYCAKFGANWLNNVQMLPSKQEKTAKYCYFQTFKNSPKN